MSWKQQLQIDLDVIKKNIILPGDEKEINMKPMNTLAMKKMIANVSMNSGNSDYSQLVALENSLDELYVDLIEEDIDMNDLYIQDRVYLLYEVRRLSKGDIFEFKYTCPECKSQSMMQVDLKEFSIIPLNKNIDRKIQVTDNIYINMWFIKRKDQKEIFKYIDKLKYKNDTELETELSVCTIASSIDNIVTVTSGEENIEDNLSLEDKLYLINNIPSHVFENMSEWLKNNTFGLDMSYTRKCIHCDHKYEVKMAPDQLL